MALYMQKTKLGLVAFFLLIHPDKDVNAKPCKGKIKQRFANINSTIVGSRFKEDL